MDQATATLAIGIGTILASGVTSAVVTYALNRKKERFEFLRGKAETLYLAADQFVKLLSSHAITYYPLLRGEIDWNQMLDLQIESGSMPSKHEGAEVMEMIVALYFPSVRAALAALFEARDRLNRITSEMKQDYRQLGFVPAERHGPAFQEAVDAISESGHQLQMAAVAAARATLRARIVED